MHDELLLMAVVTGLYLYDSALLLYCNEGILRADGGGRWTAHFGFDHTRILGKDIFIPNPFLPHRPLYRLSWEFTGAPGAAGEDWSAGKDAYAALTPMVWSIALALFVCIPLGLFTRLADRMLLMGVVILYVNILAALLWMWFHRQSFHLSGRQFSAIAFESLVCSPFAINLIRKTSLRIPVREDLVHASRRLQNPAGWNATRDILVKRLDEEIEGEEPGSGRMNAMQANRHALMEPAP